jgi:glutamyl-tRNA synthetase
MWPLRISIAGKTVTPGGAVELCHILGKDEVIRRMEIGINKLK